MKHMLALAESCIFGGELTDGNTVWEFKYADRSLTTICLRLFTLVSEFAVV